MSVLGALAVVLAGPASPGQAAVIAPSALNAVITLPGTALGAVGATAPGITTAAVTASSTGAGMNIVVGNAVATGGAAGAGVAAPAALVAGAAVVGFGVGHFIAAAECHYGVDDLCMPVQASYVRNHDVPVDTAGFTVGWPRVVPTVGGAGGRTASATLGWTTTPTWHQTTAVAYSWNANFQQAFTVWNETLDMTFQLWCRTIATGVVASVGGGTFSGGTPTNSQYRMAAPGTPLSTSGTTGTCGAGKDLDHIKVDENGGTFSATTIWYPVGHASRPAAPDADPLRHFHTIGQCVKGAAASFVSANSQNFRESYTNVPVYPDVTCPAGFGLIGLTVHKITPATSGDDLVWEWEPDPDTDPWATIPKDYPECAGGTCVLRLWRLLDGSRINCFNTPGACRGWYADTAKATNYECTYGTHVMTLADCDVYRPTFDVLVETEGGPKTETSPDTGLGTDPGTHANPDGTVTDGDPVTDPGASRQCPPDAGFLSFLNPFWLFDTLKCAFVPTVAGLQAGWASAEVDWCTTGPGALMCAAQGIFAPFLTLGTGIDPEDCLGADIPLVDLRHTRAEDTVIHPFQACTPPASTISELVLGVGSGVIYIGAFLTGAQMLARTIGAEDGVPA